MKEEKETRFNSYEAEISCKANMTLLY